jgi:hypothetical protein
VSDSAETLSPFRRGAKPFHVLVERAAARVLADQVRGQPLVRLRPREEERERVPDPPLLREHGGDSNRVGGG